MVYPLSLPPRPHLPEVLYTIAPPQGQVGVVAAAGGLTLSAGRRPSTKGGRGKTLLPISWDSFSSRWTSRFRKNNITIACRLTYIQIIFLPDEITDNLLLAFRRPLSWLRGALCALRRLFWKLGRPLRWLRRALSPFRRTLRQLGRTLCPLRRPLRRFRRPLSRLDLPLRAAPDRVGTAPIMMGAADYCKSWSHQRISQG